LQFTNNAVDPMKKQILVAALMFAVGVGPAYGQKDDASTERKILSCAAMCKKASLSSVEKNFSAALESENDGVVESALAHVTRMKLCLPARRFPRLEAVVADLAKSGRTPAIRYKAYIAVLVFDSPELFMAEQAAEFGTPDELYAAISHRLQTSLLGFTEAR
jgi:hypothetical protein